ncbi:hypothetical protein [Microvirga calopogonii]|uniref:hypothetical protein n=1 Tax=Microvirga calopogonii TaxID=2078013 RepID=UPI000E0D2F8C|nr:hypothetical protein [Microvirga calopogonii]
MKRTLLAALSILMPLSAYAASCAEYPRMVGVDPEALLNDRFIATASVPVSFDDVSAVNDARSEATMAAKALISETLSSSVKRDEVVSRAVEEASSIQGQSKEAKRKELITRMTTLSSSTEAILRGAVIIGQCYTGGREYRVTVGIKPETIQAADNMAAKMQGSDRGSSSQGNNTNSGPKGTLSGVKGFSDTEALSKF